MLRSYQTTDGVTLSEVQLFIVMYIKIVKPSIDVLKTCYSNA